MVPEPRRDVDNWIFGLRGVVKEAHVSLLIRAHNDVYDMFLRKQPLIVVRGGDIIRARPRGLGLVSACAGIVTPVCLCPPYTEFLVNTDALDVLEGETMMERLAGLLELGCERADKVYLLEWLYGVQKLGIYLVVGC